MSHGPILGVTLLRKLVACTHNAAFVAVRNTVHWCTTCGAIKVGHEWHRAGLVTQADILDEEKVFE